MIALIFSTLLSIAIMAMTVTYGTAVHIDGYPAHNRNQIIKQNLTTISTALYTYLQKNDATGPSWSISTAHGIAIPLSSLSIPTDSVIADMVQYTAYAVVDSNSASSVFGWVVYSNPSFSNDDVLRFMHYNARNTGAITYGGIVDNNTPIVVNNALNVVGSASPQGDFNNIIGDSGIHAAYTYLPYSSTGNQTYFNSASFPTFPALQTHAPLAQVHLSSTTSNNTFQQKQVLIATPTTTSFTFPSPVSALKVYLCSGGAGGGGAVRLNMKYAPSSLDMLFTGHAGQNGQCGLFVYNNTAQPIAQCSLSISAGGAGGAATTVDTSSSLVLASTAGVNSSGSYLSCVNVSNTVIFAPAVNGGFSANIPIGTGNVPTSNTSFFNTAPYEGTNFGFYFDQNISIFLQTFTIWAQFKKWIYNNSYNGATMIEHYSNQLAMFNSDPSNTSYTFDTEDYPQRVVPVIAATSGYPTINENNYISNAQVSAYESIMGTIPSGNTVTGYESDVDTGSVVPANAYLATTRTTIGALNKPLNCGQGGAGGVVFSTLRGPGNGIGAGQAGADGCAIIEY